MARSITIAAFFLPKESGFAGRNGKGFLAHSYLGC